MRELFMNTEETNHANGSQCRGRALSYEVHFPISKLQLKCLEKASVAFCSISWCHACPVYAQSSGSL